MSIPNTSTDDSVRRVADFVAHLERHVARACRTRGYDGWAFASVAAGVLEELSPHRALLQR